VPADVTKLLIDWNNGDEEALERLMPLVYDELHRLAESAMRRERNGHTLQPTVLVHEAFLKLVDQNRVEWRNRSHFIGVAAQLMRRVTIQYAERKRTAKRGGGVVVIPFDDTSAAVEVTATHLLDLNEALERLADLDERQARIVEMRFFGGLTGEEIATALDVSRSTIDREWRVARAWLQRELGDLE